MDFFDSLHHVAQSLDCWIPSIIRIQGRECIDAGVNNEDLSAFSILLKL